MLENLCEDQAAIEALIQRALVEMEQDDWGDDPALLKLRGCANKPVLDAAEKLCKSSLPAERILATCILAQFMRVEIDENGKQHFIPVFVDERVHILLTMLSQEQDPEVLMEIGMGFSYIEDARIIEPLVALKNHPDDKVRSGVAWGLAGYDDDRAVNALIELAQDSDYLVRDWATFGLGSLSDLDTPAIREILLKNIHDEDEIVRNEALKGLMERKDQSIIPHLLNEIEIGRIEIDSEIAALFYEMIKDLPEAKTNSRLEKFMQAHKGTSDGRESL